MTRLDDLMALRNRIDAEIKAEMRTVRRLEELSADAGIATTQSEVQRIMRAVADAHSVEVSDMVGPSRERNVTQARMIAAWLLRDEGLPLTQVGRLLCRDHTTVMYAVNKVGKSPALRAIATTIGTAGEAVA